MPTDIMNYEGYEIYHFDNYYYLQTEEDFTKCFYGLSEIQSFIDQKPEVRKRREEIIRKRKESFLKTEMLTSLPQGWKPIQGAMTQPRGCIWVSNNKSRFKRDKDGNRIRKEALLIIDEELYKTSKHYKEKLLLQMR